MNTYKVPGFVLDAVATFMGWCPLILGYIARVARSDADKAFLANFDTIASTGSIYTLQDQGIVLSIQS
jgi:hypothetical protein